MLQLKKLHEPSHGCPSRSSFAWSKSLKSLSYVHLTSYRSCCFNKAFVDNDNVKGMDFVNGLCCHSALMTLLLENVNLAWKTVVLERDLAIFGFFIALGRSTQSFLYANGFEALDEPIEGFVRYLIGGSVLYYPQLSSISSYQLYVEVVCEELDWLPFYPGISNTSKRSHHHKSKMASPPNAEAIPIVLDVCSHWLQSFIKYSRWLEKPFSVKAARFLSRGHNKLWEWTEELGMQKKLIESTAGTCVERTDSVTYSPARKEPDSFDKSSSHHGPFRPDESSQVEELNNLVSVGGKSGGGIRDIGFAGDEELNPKLPQFESAAKGIEKEIVPFDNYNSITSLVGVEKANRLGVGGIWM
ncbi:unnamed protein product [Ilex paraguariensis]|uniref:Uncharacterized protein n=1 Tax=Ilex paraguariensis TaxID=185542 RepID=A0ABC8SRM0_9AQUA